MTRIESSLFDEGWQENYGIDYDSLQWPETGEFLNASTFAERRETGGWVIANSTPPEAVRAAIMSPPTMIATDGIMKDGIGHLRTSGTYSLVLGRYVRESNDLSLMDAIHKMTLMPARRLETRVPAFKNKGRIREGADADIAIFDPDVIIDTSTYEQPTLPPRGMAHVLVNGVPVLSDGELNEETTPGKGIRA